jgi:hypothetical protein
MVALEMLEYLQDAVERLSFVWNIEEGGTWHEMHHFRRECGKRVAQRLKDALDEIRGRAQATGGAGGAVVVLTEWQKAQAWIRANMQTTSIRHNTRGLGRAGDAGRAAGDTVSFADQVGGGRSGVLGIGRG